MEIAKKISVGGINGVRSGFKNVTELTRVARIFGVVNSFDIKDTTFGKSFSFKGDFRAINEDGEEVAAPVCYLPAPADGMLVAALTETPGKSVNFAFDIFVSPKEKRGPQDLGYEYKVKPLLDTKPSDPMAALMAMVEPLAIEPRQAELPALENEAATEPEPEPKKSHKK